MGKNNFRFCLWLDSFTVWFLRWGLDLCVRDCAGFVLEMARLVFSGVTVHLELCVRLPLFF